MPEPRKRTPRPRTTSWEAVAPWYDDLLEREQDTYQEHVIAPNLLRILSLKGGESLLDIGCGQGYFARKYQEAGARVTGVDLSPTLIQRARELSREITYQVASGDALGFARDGECEIATAILSLQNMKNLQGVCAEAGRVLTPQGRFVMVLNHPAFRIPHASSWGYDEAQGVQYRRLDGYLRSREVRMLAHPSNAKSAATLSYHHSLQDISKALHRAGFVIARLEEWVSHKKSGRGPRQQAEDTARSEFPLFLMIEAKKVS